MHNRRAPFLWPINKCKTSCKNIHSSNKQRSSRMLVFTQSRLCMRVKDAYKFTHSTCVVLCSILFLTVFGQNCVGALNIVGTCSIVVVSCSLFIVLSSSVLPTVHCWLYQMTCIVLCIPCCALYKSASLVCWGFCSVLDFFCEIDQSIWFSKVDQSVIASHYAETLHLATMVGYGNNLIWLYWRVPAGEWIYYCVPGVHRLILHS